MVPLYGEDSTSPAPSRDRELLSREQEPLVCACREAGILWCMGNRVILGGVLACLVLLALEIGLLVVSGNWVALALALTVVGGVQAAMYAMGRPRDRQRRRLR